MPACGRPTPSTRAIEIPRTYRPRKPKFIIAEKRPPGGKEAAKKAGAVGPVTRGQLTHAVDKALKAQRAEILKEIAAADIAAWMWHSTPHAVGER